MKLKRRTFLSLITTVNVEVSSKPRAPKYRICAGDYEVVMTEPEKRAFGRRDGVAYESAAKGLTRSKGSTT